MQNVSKFHFYTTTRIHSISPFKKINSEYYSAMYNSYNTCGTGCSVNMMNNTIFQETGQCDCRENVGGPEDAMCCNCAPGYFNLTDQGCQRQYRDICMN